jgi:RNA polymerase sigma-70 factor, ECF subfamily
MTASSADIPFELELEHHRTALTRYCGRLLGGPSEAEDAVQETMVRAWRRADSLQERAALRGWLHRIAANVCSDFREARKRRAVPMPPDAEPPDDDADPAQLTDRRAGAELALVVALHHLPPRQRAVLVLREVLQWRATEVAELLQTSVPSVNSALQRARATLARLDLDAADVAPAGTDPLLARHVAAFEHQDLRVLVAVLQDAAGG